MRADSDTTKNKAVRAATQTASTKYPLNNTSNSISAQRARLLDFLSHQSSITTLDARKLLDVLHPAMRILELRSLGFRIDTVWVKQETECGKLHRVAKYVLVDGVAHG